MIRHTVAILLLMTGAAFAQDVAPKTKNRTAKCAVDNAVQKWLTINTPSGRSIRVEMNPCDKFGNPTADKELNLTFDTKELPKQGKCLRFGNGTTTVWVKEPGAKEYVRLDEPVCLEREKS